MILTSISLNVFLDIFTQRNAWLMVFKYIDPFRGCLDMITAKVIDTLDIRIPTFCLFWDLDYQGWLEGLYGW